MRKFTERMTFTVPASVKVRLKADAARRGMSLSAHLRDITDDLVALHDLEIELAKVERKDMTVQ